MISDLADSMAHDVPGDSSVKISRESHQFLLQTPMLLEFVCYKSIICVARNFERVIVMHVRHQPKGVSKQLPESAYKETGTHTQSPSSVCAPTATILLRLQTKEEEEEKETEKEHRRVREH